MSCSARCLGKEELPQMTHSNIQSVVFQGHLITISIVRCTSRCRGEIMVNGLGDLACVTTKLTISTPGCREAIMCTAIEDKGEHIESKAPVYLVSHLYPDSV